MENIFAIYKPKGYTSNDIVNIVKKARNEKKVGHAGTLDPLATGVLVIGVGREATKKLGDIVKHEKEYVATIKFGVTSTTDDEEGEKTEVEVTEIPELDDIRKILVRFQGKISQTPPLFSAVKVKGKEAYKLARKGQKVELKPRQVEIKNIEILSYEWPILKLKVITGPGVYIRSLARDIGEQLNVGGYLTDLERTRVGQFNKDNSISLEELSTKQEK